MTIGWSPRWMMSCFATFCEPVKHMQGTNGWSGMVERWEREREGRMKEGTTLVSYKFGQGVAKLRKGKSIKGKQSGRLRSRARNPRPQTRLHHPSRSQSFAFPLTQSSGLPFPATGKASGPAFFFRPPNLSPGSYVHLHFATVRAKVPSSVCTMMHLAFRRNAAWTAALAAAS